MDVFYCEHDVFPAKYNFKDEADGASGTDIDFVDAATVGANTTATIIAVLDGHKKVLQLYDNDGAALIELRHNFSDNQTYGTIEFFIRSSDVTKSNYLIFRDSGGTILFYFGIVGSNFAYFDAGWQSIVAATNDIWYHIRIEFECTAGAYQGLAQYDWHVYIAGTHYGDYDFLNNQANMKSLYIFTSSPSSGYYGYYDAIGYSWDANYEVGDNLEVDFHYYNKEEITDIIQHPTITPRLDAYWIGEITIRDFEGSLFSSWHDRDFNKILIEDNSDNVLFRGFLIKKKFTNKEMFLFFAGIGVLLDWQPFGSDGYINYILAEGLVKAPISSDSILQCKDNDGADFTWAVDTWIEGGKDLGLLIVDKTTVNTREWDSSAISQSGGTVTSGNNASITGFDDGDYYNARDSDGSPSNLNLIVTPVIDGIAINDTDFLQSIEIQYSFRARVSNGALGRNYGTIYFQILKDTEWITITTVSVDQMLNTFTTAWHSGIPLDVEGGNGNQEVIKDTDAELQKFFDKTGATYTSLKGMRFKLLGGLEAPGYIEVHVDYIKVKPAYVSYDVSPIMTTITKNTATSLTSADVSVWDESGVVTNDGFKIGVSTRKVIEDVAGRSGLSIKRVDNYGNSTVTSNTFANADTATIQWSTTGGDHFGELDDDNDATYVDTTGHLQDDIYDFGDVNLRGGYVTLITIYCRQKCNIVDKMVLELSYSIDGGSSWSSAKDDALTVNWANESVGWSGLEVYDLSNFQVKLHSYETVAGGQAFCSKLYVVFTISGSSWSKYIAREFRGSYCIEPLKAVCKLEGAHWYEDYVNDRIVVIKPADFVDSTVNITSGGKIKWEFEDDCNQVKSFYVFGKAEDAIFAKAVDESISGYISKQIIDETITNVGDAQEIADAQLALLKTKRPSVKIPLPIGTYPLIQLGTTVDLTMVRPTVAEAAYPIRMIERSKVGASIKTVIYCGLGESTMAEKIAKTIRNNAFRSHKALTDRLISP